MEKEIDVLEALLKSTESPKFTMENVKIALMMRINDLNKRIIEGIKSKGIWRFCQKSGYDGFKCSKCKTWVHFYETRICKCDKY